MQSVASAFTAVEKAPLRRPVASSQVSWKKGLNPAIRLFTIGVSAIGGEDIIGGSAGYAFAWNKYQYFDESDYLLEMDYERKLNFPLGGAVKALANMVLDNNSGRFTPRHMGGTSELFTAILPRRPVILNAGFEVEGIDSMIPQFVGIGTRMPKVNMRSRSVQFEAADMVDFLQNKYVDRTAMFTGLRSDELIENMLSGLGYQTADYDLDIGTNMINFALFETGERFADIINRIVQAENGHFYQDEQGRLIFRNRNSWASTPYNSIQKIITTGMVIESYSDTDQDIVNVVEIKANPRAKAPAQILWQLAAPIELPVGSTELFINFDDPILEIVSRLFTANSQEGGGGTDRTSSVTISRADTFAQAEKLTFTNAYSSPVFLTGLTVNGRPAIIQNDLYYREEIDSSVTAYEERVLSIENDYIQSDSWAASIAGIILRDFSSPSNLQRIRIRAIPELQMGDLISWQGRYWRVYGIATEFDPMNGFLQVLDLLQRDDVEYFQIGVSTIGGIAMIAP